MRFIIYVTILFSVLPLVFTRPFFGLCVYLVVSLLQPKILCWQPGFQDAMLVGVPLVIGAIFFGVNRLVPIAQRNATGQILSVKQALYRSPLFEPAWPLIVAAILLIYISMTRVLTPYPLAATSGQYRSLCKVLLVTALLTGLACDYRRVRSLYIIVALAVGFWAIKGGFKVMLLGPHQVYGKTYDNNLFALTSVMVLPMLFYFALSVRHARWRFLLLAFSALTCLAIIGSRSRAGFVAFVVVLGFMALGSRYRMRALFAVGMVAVLALVMSGQEIKDRVNSILAYRQDRSAQSRFETWDTAMELLERSPLIGVGFANFEVAKDAQFGGRKAAHNIYLQNLTELGLIGHPIWLLLMVGSLISAFRFMRRSRKLGPEFKWAYQWSRGLFLGMLAFCIHGAFHNEEYLELMFTLIGLNVALQNMTKREVLRHRLTAACQPATVRAVSPIVAPQPVSAPQPWGFPLPAGLASMAGRGVLTRWGYGPSSAPG
jgi:probable O-glycosylation ligase (exosortase A-associated)